jgi:hypothetical protein
MRIRRSSNCKNTLTHRWETQEITCLMKPKQTGIVVHSLSRTESKKRKQQSNKRIRQAERKHYEPKNL